MEYLVGFLRLKKKNRLLSKKYIYCSRQHEGARPAPSLRRARVPINDLSTPSSHVLIIGIIYLIITTLFLSVHNFNIKYN